MTDKTYETLPIIKYDVNIATISKLRQKYMPLVITDPNDKEQFDAVHEARMVMVKVRTTIEKERVAKKAAALKYGKDVDAAAKILFDESAPVEEHLKTEEDKVLLERKRIEEEEARIEKEKIQGRVDAFGKYRHMMPFMEVATMTDEEFTAKLAEVKEAYEAEAKRLDDEQKARDAEAAQLAAERAEIDRIKAEQEEAAKAQEAEKKALEAERQELEAEKKAEADRKAKEVFEKQAKEDAKIQAEKDLAEKVNREAEETKKKEAGEKAEIARQEELKPDKEKLIDFAKRIPEVPAPEVKDEMAKRIINLAMRNLIEVSDNIIEQLEEM